MNIYDLISRAQKLRQETKLDSVSPDRVGALCEDTLKYINEFQLLASSPSLHKIYASVSAMQADKSPKSDLTGKALKPGQLVVIVPANQSDATAGDVYRYDGPSGNTSAWTFVSKIGAVPADAELNATSANPVQNKVVTEKLTELESETTHKIGGIISASSASSLSYGYESRIDFSAIKGSKIRLDIDNQSAFVSGKTIAFVSDGFATIYKQFPFDAFDVELANDMTYVRCSVNPANVSSIAEVAMVMQTNGLLPSSIESLRKSIDALKESFDETLYEIVTPKIENGKYITATGYVGDSSTSCITDFAYVGNTTKVVVENVNMAESRAIVGYDESKSVVASWDEYEDGEELSIPSDVAYIRLNGFIGVAPIITIRIEHITDKKIELVNDRVEALSEEITYQIGEHYSATAATHLSYGYTNRIDHSLNKGTTIHISLDNQSAFVKGKTIAFVSDGFATIYKQFPFDAFDVELANDMTYVRCSANPDGVKSVADVAFTIDVFGFLGGKIKALEQKDKDLFKSIARPIITIIDDDTLGYDSVKLFHDVCVQNGIIGTYATVTSIALSDERIIPLMQQYEQEGFHFAIHGKTQSPSYSPEFNAPEAEKDFVEGMRQMQSANFLDWKFFIIPYGAYQPELQQMAKKWGCKCAVGIGQNAYINKSVKVNRFYLPRVGFNAQETGSVTLEQLKALIDEAASNNGWVLVGTHIYDGWTEELLTTKFAEMVQYAKNAGLTFVTLNEGYRQFEPYFTYNEMH